MATIKKFPPKTFLPPLFLRNPIPPHSKPKSLFSPSNSIRFCTSSVDSGNTHSLFHRRCCSKSSRTRVRVSNSQLKENWLDSLSCPFPEKADQLGINGEAAGSGAGAEWVVGIDPDISGALAVLKGDYSGLSAQVVSLLIGY